MSWLFGGSAKEEKKVGPTPEESLKALGSQIDNIEKRSKLLDSKSKKLVQEALQKKKNKDEKGALLCLKRKKMYENEMNKMDGMRVLMEQQRMQLEGNFQNILG